MLRAGPLHRCTAVSLWTSPKHLRSWRSPAGRAAPTRAMATEQGHSVPSSSVVAADSVDPEVQRFQALQAAAPRLTLAEEARTLVAGAGFGVMSTISAGDPAGFPSGSVVEYAADAAGRPVFSLSTLSPHTGDLRKDPRCSLTVLAPGFRGLADARVAVTGRVVPLPDAELAAAKELYLARHPGSFWVEFGDFSWFKMEGVLAARLVGGFARAGRVSGEDYAAAAPDPVAQFSAPVCGHMNADHGDAVLAMVRHYAGISVDEATMLSLDRLGVNVACVRQGQTFKARLPFPRPATDRKAIKDLVVEMTRAAAAAAAEQGAAA